jgi:hypothetical protein
MKVRYNSDLAKNQGRKDGSIKLTQKPACEFNEQNIPRPWPREQDLDN